MDNSEKIFQDICGLKIQGATNVALSVLDAFIAASQELKSNPVFQDTLYQIGHKLAYARPTEPLAQNSLRFIFENRDQPIGYYRQKAEDYRQILLNAGNSLKENSLSLIQNGGSYLTHCHSRTVVETFIGAKNRGVNFRIYVTETRPLYQGRRTALELYEAGISDVTIMADSASAQLLTGRENKIDAVFLGADLLTQKGFANKVGTLALCHFAQYSQIPVYSLTSLLKFDPRPFSPALLEKRPSAEVWENSRVNLRVYNPAFDYTPYFPDFQLVTECGTINGGQVLDKVMESYPFILKGSEYLKNS